MKNSIFVLKDNNDTENKKEISIVEWLSLDTDERALYKEDNILGDNNNNIISNEEYLNLPNDAAEILFKSGGCG